MAGDYIHSLAQTARRSVSGDFPRAPSHARNAGTDTALCTHQRAVSASSLTPIAPYTRAARRPWAGLRARTTTATAADYVSAAAAEAAKAKAKATEAAAAAAEEAAAAGLPSPPATASSSGSGAGHILGSIPSSSPGADPIPSSGAYRPRKRSLSVGGESSCGAFFVRQVEQYGLQAVLASPVAVCYFLASAIAGYSPENLLFYLEAEHFRTASFSSDERRLRYAKGLYKAFVSHRSPLEINISHAMRQRILRAFQSGAPVPVLMFDETQAHAYALLEGEFANFRQRPLFQRMLADLAVATPSRKDALAQHSRAVAAIFEALASTYGIRTIAPSKALLVESEMPAFTKFADMDLTSTEMRLALPAWLCRTIIRLLDTPLPLSTEDMRQQQPAPPSPPKPVSVSVSVSVPPPAADAKKANKQKSLPRLRFRFQQDAAAAATAVKPPTSPPPPPSVKARWDSLWSSRRRKA